ncbi:beta-ketoacyl-[acyl-carrier-protein] synthase family protein [Streptomonospora nanhaiensis]|uniref:3-oxoacyl-[acyl-carrier-protein] synthase 1 n=1 Tax=Streptomonospora nanhaiensis TaxID=1323731 RepID=A0ABY6YPG7_9ACTN|nr:beta-ketoacyl-[acyl-carrier-protein] synthase family protein [Streptomonospora nanhaiensis]WAE74092.1 beta-ketoacyl-[acyl-carrier-protein] synthase family protein [Streptomonospora nanhaiensis]
MPETRRVVITGLGAVSSVGIGADAFAAAIRGGRNGTAEITSFDASGFPYRMAGEVRGFAPREILRRIDPDRWGRSGQLAAAASRLALEDSGLEPEAVSHGRSGVIMGTTSGEATVSSVLGEQWVSGRMKEFSSRVVAQAPASQISAAVGAELGLGGDTLTVPTACSASNYALGHAFDLVRTGEADLMFAGGADAVNRFTHAGFHALGALAPDVCRPFDKDRAGIITGEGGVSLLLEPLDSAVARGARVYAEILGYGVNCDAKHMVHPDPGSIAACIRDAHASAGITPDQVDYVCAHGTGTPTNDATEVQAVREVFGERVPPISSIKSMIGHTMGAASGFGAVVCCKALHDGFLPPTANVGTVDPALGPDLDVVPGRGRDAAPRIVQNHGFAFGGNNVITILGRPA